MEPKTVVITVIACHFKNKNELCNTTIKRLAFALVRAGVYYQSNVYFFVTGHVPYEAGGKTMAELMKEYLVSKGISEDKVIIASGTGIFSEARSVTQEVKRRFPKCNEIIIFSSD